jgi:hypothetical protein
MAGGQGIVYLLASINMVLKTRLHHIGNGHKSISALDFGLASRSAPFCVLRKISVLRIFCAELRKALISALFFRFVCEFSAVLRKKQGAFCALVCLFLLCLVIHRHDHQASIHFIIKRLFCARITPCS